MAHPPANAPRAMAKSPRDSQSRNRASLRRRSGRLPKGPDRPFYLPGCIAEDNPFVPWTESNASTPFTWQAGDKAIVSGRARGALVG